MITFCRIFLSASLAVFCSFNASLVRAQDSRPNILLVVVDDMGWTDIGSYGSEIDTPNLDKLAEMGVKFTDFHASVSCSPTRSMLLSGTDNHIAGLGNMGELLSDNQKGQPGYEGHLNDRVVSLAEVLKDNGYHTYMAGKWHLGHEPDLYPRARGFDRTLALLYGGASHYADMSGLMEHETPAYYTSDGVKLQSLPPEFYSSRNYASFLIDAIRENRDSGNPFLAYLAFTSPHDPMHVPRPWSNKYDGRYDAGYEVLHSERVARAIELGLVPEGTPVPNRDKSVKAWDSLSLREKVVSSRGMEIYAGMISNLDYHYGRVVQFLDDIGELDNTVIIFMSDNGPNPWFSWDYPQNKEGIWLDTFDNSLEAMGTKESAYAYGPGWASASSGPLDAFKLTVAEGGIRVPFIISAPGMNGGRKTDAFAYVWDVMPTILDILKIEHPVNFKDKPVERMIGRSLVPLLKGESDHIYADDETVAGELTNGKWIRRGKYKALSIPKPYGDGSWALYDVEADPGENADLSKTEPELLSKLVAAWDAYADGVGIIPFEPSH